MKKILFCCIFCAQLAWAESFFYTDDEVFESDVFIQTHGDKNNPALLLVHGLGDNASRDWAGTVQRLQEEFYILTFDLPGFGKSRRSDKLYSPRNYARLIDNMAEKFIQKKFHLAGHSMGAAVALKYAQLHENNVISLALIDAAGILHRSAYGKFLIQTGVKDFLQPQNGTLQDIMESKTVHNFINSVTNTADEALGFDSKTVVNNSLLRKTILQSDPATIAALALLQADFEGIDNIKTPTLLLWGQKDDIAPLQTGYALDTMLPRSRLTTLPQSGHVPMKTDFEQYIRILRDHLKNPAAFQKRSNADAKQPQKIVFNGAKDQTVRGTIEELIITDSHNITVEDATIKQMQIRDSHVGIRNSELTDTGTFSVSNTTLDISGCHIRTRLKSQNSTIKIAGCYLYTDHDSAIVALSKTTVIYSISMHNGIFLHQQNVRTNRSLP